MGKFKSTSQLLRWFKRDRKPNRTDLDTLYAKFYGLADYLVETLPESPEKTIAMRSLIDAKNNAVMAKIEQLDGPGS